MADIVRLAELRMKKILDERSMVEGAKEEGKIEGKKEIAENLINLGMSMDVVIEVTGLSAEELDKMYKQMHKKE